MYVSDLKHPTQVLEDKLLQLYTLNRDKKIDLSFRPPYLELLEAYSNPHLNLPPIIHVAGTNGKGSTIATMRAILKENGYKVHTYTSPHLCRFNERIYLAGQDISDNALKELIDEALTLGGDKDLTFFEITTAMAFAAFAHTEADILLLEVGLGGRLDCTNVIKSPLATIITSISYDHTEHLGETLSSIAFEKAGVIKENTPCIIGAQNKEAIDEGIINVFESKANELNAPLFCYDADWFIEQQENQISFCFNNAQHYLPLPNLVGQHQIHNAGAALAALHIIQNDLPTALESTKTGLRKIKWKGRLQRLKPEHYNLDDGWELWLDGGHNKSASEILAAQARNWTQNDLKPLHLVIGMMAHKDPADFLTPLLPFLQSVTATNIPNEPSSLSAEKLRSILKAANPELIILQAEKPQQAIAQICKNNHEPGYIIITGSLYLAGHVLKET